MLHHFHAHIYVLQGKQHEYLKLFPSSLFMACMHIYMSSNLSYSLIKFSFGPPTSREVLQQAG